MFYRQNIVNSKSIYRLVVKRFTDEAKFDQHRYWQHVKFNTQPTAYANCVVKILSDPYLIIEAQKLVFNMFHETSWKWQANNPTGFQYNMNNDGQRYITDRFENNSVWSGALVGGRLMACGRLVYRRKNISLDVEGYNLNSAEKKLIARRNTVELQRGMVTASHRGKGVTKILFALAATHAINAKSNIVVTAAEPPYISHGIGRILNDSFDYGDGHKVKLAYYSENDLLRIIAFAKGTISI